MNPTTALALIAFLMALLLEVLICLSFERRLRRLHPAQWRHSRENATGVRRGARMLMIYLRDRSFRSSLDRDGVRYCNRNRSAMLISYWATPAAGLVLLGIACTTGW
ncbi:MULTISPECIES: hypothetical protein [Lysobacter]|jgi:hypothetical protein|uniref:Transmembrane protein n=1 Tax=Lysobacter gummosus TaxID=262324 RepID=A0ABY3X624_9GAMM|nr:MULTISPECIES: hypothetical protein [Lysobacter]ALN92439.1 hypothetical protein LG3211_3493 [Lysobacter gummosus]UJB20663.1 hypothetical protein L1A79_06200 [Lysobacter capsici]UJQ30223.1 hypothetical protein L2D09_08660 [Lysobacter gummosus]UNP28021.1 hypothetical protein MOV92_16130 [Lysobacter gummosus]